MYTTNNIEIRIRDLKKFMEEEYAQDGYSELYEQLDSELVDLEYELYELRKAESDND